MGTFEYEVVDMNDAGSLWAEATHLRSLVVAVKGLGGDFA